MKYTVYIDDNFHYMDEEERSSGGVFRSADEAKARAAEIVDRSIRWERLQAKNPDDPDELYDRYTDFGDDPFVVSDDPDFHFSAWDYAKQRCQEIVKEDLNDKNIYDFSSQAIDFILFPAEAPIFRYQKRAVSYPPAYLYSF